MQLSRLRDEIAPGHFLSSRATGDQHITSCLQATFHAAAQARRAISPAQFCVSRAPILGQASSNTEYVDLLAIDFEAAHQQQKADASL